MITMINCPVDYSLSLIQQSTVPAGDHTNHGNHKNYSSRQSRSAKRAGYTLYTMTTQDTPQVLPKPYVAHPPIRALFIDIDGTLTGATDTVSPGARDAVQKARARGVEVILCTGRARHTAEPIARQLGPPLGYAVTSNGGIALHLDTNQILHRHLLPIPVALQIINAIIAIGSEPYVYEEATTGDISGARVLYHPNLRVGPFATPNRYLPYADITRDLPFEPVSISAFGSPAKMRPLVDKLVAQLPEGLAVIQSGSDLYWGIEIFVGGVSKRLGLQTLAAHLGIRQAETMAIGDHLNDVEMLAWAGVGVAMGNAVPEVKAVADWITSSQSEDGVARAIERFILA